MNKFLILFLFLIISCTNENKNNFIVEFDNNQYDCLKLNKAEKRYSLKRKDGSIFQIEGAVITFLSNSRKKIDTISKGGTIISSVIIEYKEDAKYGLISQKPFEKICDIEGGKVTPAECEELLNKSNYFSYWILVKAKNEIYGPLNIRDYKEFKKSLNISNTLKLDIE